MWCTFTFTATYIYCRWEDGELSYSLDGYNLLGQRQSTRNVVEVIDTAS